jgi:hypothetical protein
MDWIDGKVSDKVATEEENGDVLRGGKKGKGTLLVNAARFGNAKQGVVDFEV